MSHNNVCFSMQTKLQGACHPAGHSSAGTHGNGHTQLTSCMQQCSTDNTPLCCVCRGAAQMEQGGRAHTVSVRKIFPALSDSSTWSSFCCDESNVLNGLKGTVNQQLHPWPRCIICCFAAACWLTLVVL